VFERLFSAVANALGVGAYRVTLTRQHQGIVLQVFRGNRAIPLSRAATKLTLLAPFAGLRPQSDNSVVLPVSLLDDTRKTLRGLATDDVDILIAPSVDCLQRSDMPQHFQVTYALDTTAGSLVRRLPDGVDYLGDGWFATAAQYWHVQDTVPQDDLWLRLTAVEGRDIVVFMAQVASNWQQRGLPYDSAARLDQAPALSVSVQHVGDDAVELDVTWRVPTSQVRAIPTLSGYITVSETLMPGIPPQALTRTLGTSSGTIRLTTQQIPLFMRDIWPSIQPFAGGAVQRLLQLHPLLGGKCELVVELRSQLRDGVGVVSAVPVVTLGEQRLYAADLSRQLSVAGEYLRTPVGWLRRGDVTSLGIVSDARLRDGTALTPLRVSPSEVLHRGSVRLDGPWARIDSPLVRMPHGQTQAETTALHLDFLRTWHMPGGIVSTSATVRRAFAESIASVVRDYPSAKVLVVATKDTLNDLDPVWSSAHALRLDGLKKDPAVPPGLRGLVAAAPHALETAPELVRTQWSIVCLLEADTLIRSANSKLFTNLHDCRTSLVIGLFGATDFLQRTSVREAMSQVFHLNTYEDTELFQRFGLRDPRLPPPPLPSPYQLRRRAASQRGQAQPVEIRLPGPAAPGGLAIPRRSPAVPNVHSVAAVRALPIEATIEVQRTGSSAATSHEKFLADARRLVGYREPYADFMSFRCYWPTYDAMNEGQRRWYFYWRDQVRAGHCVDTSLSYIFVHIYELINNIGVQGAGDGYGQLWRLWLGYRERYSSLDHYLVEWLTDYLLVDRSGPQLMKAHIQTLPAGSTILDPDLLLSYLLDGSPLHLPTVLIEALSDYRITTSPFYRSGHHDLVDKVLSEVLRRVNAHFLGTRQLGIFDAFKPPTVVTMRRELFRSAIYGGQRTPVVSVTVVPYTRHAPLRTFLTAVVKHTENRLRELKRFEGRSHVVSLDPAVQLVIDKALGVLPKAGTTVRPIVIDMGKVDEVRKESDEVLRMLLAETESTAPADAASPPLGDRAVVPSPQIVINMERVEMLARESDEVQRLLLDGIEEANAAGIEFVPVTPPAATRGANPQDVPPHGSSAFTSSEHPVAGITAIPGDLPEEWSAFVTALTEDQRLTLRAVIELSDPMPEIRGVADRSGFMPSVLIDSINELALDTLGDYVIVADREPPTIEEQQRDRLERIVAVWAPTPSQS
jgi:hypothetical protein